MGKGYRHVLVEPQYGVGERALVRTGVRLRRWARYIAVDLGSTYALPDPKALISYT